MDKPTLIAHRGYSRIALENTMVAFKKAIEAGYTAIETDIHLTKDGVFVIHHDENLSRIYRKDLVIANTRYRRLFWSTIWRGYSKRLCTLKDYLKLCEKHKITAIIELKIIFEKHEIEKLLQFVKNKITKLVFISFFPENLALLRDSGYLGPLQILTFQPIEPSLFSMAKTLKADLDLHHNLATPGVITHCHDNNIFINVWTVDDKEKAITLRDNGVDFITTNGLLSNDFSAA